jgi:predicted DNA-binding transcriptional regulator YafY
MATPYREQKKKDEWFKSRRILTMTELLREREHTVEQLCNFFRNEATRRDVQRDLEHIESCIDDFRRIPARPPRYCIRTQANSLHPVETLAVYAATRLVYHRASGHSSHYATALRLLEQWLPESIRPIVTRSVSNIGKQRRSPESSALEKVAKAWFAGHRLQFQYQAVNGRGGLRTNELEVYFIEVHPENLALYAIGMETTYHKSVRTFKLARMKDLQIMRDTTYSIPSGFDPQAFLKHAWGITGQSDGTTVNITLRFLKSVASRIEEGGYLNMEKRLLPDERIEVSFTAGTDKTGLPLEVLVWVRGWGANVEVIEPPALRERWLEDCREVVTRYGGGHET